MGRLYCRECGWVGESHEALRAPHPFAEEGEIAGCPACREVERMGAACDVPSCSMQATSGLMVEGAYKLLCSYHGTEQMARDAKREAVGA